LPTKWSPTRVIVLMFGKSAALSFASWATAVVGGADELDGAGGAAAWLPEDPPPHATKSTAASATALTHTHPVVAIRRRIEWDTQARRPGFNRRRTTSSPEA
jgi:hypothetical protein